MGGGALAGAQPLQGYPHTAGGLRGRLETGSELALSVPNEYNLEHVHKKHFIKRFRVGDLCQW